MAPRDLVLVGVSGGADSMSLISALSALRHDLGIQLHAAHFNHRFRPEALQDQRFVENWCKRLNIPLIVGQRQGGAIKHLSEDQARQMRFDFLGKAAQSLKAQIIALGHTRNDLAETVLMRLVRGSGLYGLRAILPRRVINGMVVVRPLLDVERSDIEKYLKMKKIHFRTDKTNRQTIYERNKIRHELLPLLARQYNPKITKVLSDLAATAGEDYEFLLSHARRRFDKRKITFKGKIKIDLKGLSTEHPAILRLIFRQMAEHLTQQASSLTFEDIQALENLLSLNGQHATHLSHQLKALKTQRFLELSLI